MLKKYKNKEVSHFKNITIKDKIFKGIFFTLTLICASVIIVILAFVLVKGLQPFFKKYSEDNNPEGTIDFSNFLFGNLFKGGYNSETGKYQYGAGFLVINTLILNLYVALFSVPASILTALFISKIAPKKIAKVIQICVELLASIPSVIFGIFGLGVVVPIIGKISKVLGLASSSGISLFSGAIVLSLMISPTIISVSTTALNSINESQIQGSLALGASKTQTYFKICLNGAKSGIFAGIILGIGRSLGEATAVSMVCGSPLRNVTLNPFMPTVTLSSEVLLSIGEATPNSLNYDARFSISILLLLVILLFDLILNDVKNHFSDVNKRPLFVVRVFLFFKNKAIKKAKDNGQ